jgi:hypothetical protein
MAGRSDARREKDQKLVFSALIRIREDVVCRHHSPEYCGIPKFRTPLIAAGLLLMAFGSVKAAGGWYLLTPPVTEYNEKAGYLERIRVLTDVPLSKWNHGDSFDTAADCEAVRYARTQLETRFRATAVDEYQKSLSVDRSPADRESARRTLESAHSREQVLALSRCIASDDSRLR